MPDICVSLNPRALSFVANSVSASTVNNKSKFQYQVKFIQLQTGYSSVLIWKMYTSYFCHREIVRNTMNIFASCENKIN